MAFKLCFLCVCFAIKLAFVAGILPGTFLVWCDVFHSSPVHTVLHIVIVFFFQWMLNFNDTTALANTRLQLTNSCLSAAVDCIRYIRVCMYTWIFWSYLPNDSTELCQLIAKRVIFISSLYRYTPPSCPLLLFFSSHRHRHGGSSYNSHTGCTDSSRHHPDSSRKQLRASR